jgi:hypothetical protein
MYKRFVSSLLAPAAIVQFRNDKLIKVLLYVVFFALLLSTRMIIQTTTYNGISYYTSTQILQQLHEVSPDCHFDDTSLICDTEEVYEVYQDGTIAFYLDGQNTFIPSIYLNPYSFVVHADKLYIVYAGTVVKEEALKDALPLLMNLDFSHEVVDQNAFDARIITALNDYILSYKFVWAPILIGMDFLVNVMLFLFFDLFSAWMLRLRFPKLPFVQTFKMSVYSATALYLILILNSLFGLDSFLLIILLIIAFRQNSQLSYEILRRLNRKS